MPLSVKISNSLLNAAYTLSLNESRLIMYAVTQLGDQINEEIEVPIAACADLYNMGRSNCRTTFNTASKSLFNRVFVLTDDAKQRRMRWLITDSACTDGVLTLKFHPDLAPYLLELKNNFTVYALSRAGDFRLSYSWHLFLMLMQFRKSGEVYKTPEQFREMMGLSDYYAANFSRVRVKVLNPALKEIREKAGLDVKLTVEKKAQRISLIKFTFPVEQQNALPLTKGKPKTAAAKPASTAKPKITKAYIDQHARPGESYDQARQRLSQQVEKAA